MRLRERYRGAIDPDNGTPVIYRRTRRDGPWEVAAQGTYPGLAVVHTLREDAKLVVAGDYWRGLLPVGVLLRVEEV